MLRKPFFTAGRAAKSRPPVLCFCYLHHRPAVSTRKGSPANGRTNFFGMFPIQPFTMSRAELNPSVRRLGHPYQLAAFQTAKATQRVLCLRGPPVVISAVPVGVPSAIGTAVFLRHSVGDKFLPAYSAYGLPPHKPLQPSPAEIYLMMPLSKTRKKDSTRLCCLKNTSYITGHTYPRIVLKFWAQEIEGYNKLRSPPPVLRTACMYGNIYALSFQYFQLEAI